MDLDGNPDLFDHHMRKPYTQLYVHLVWSTWKRLPLLTPELELRIYGLFHRKCERFNCKLIAVGGVEDHVHLLVRYHPAITIAELVRHLKGSSSHLVTHEIQPGEFFKWQGAFGAFTVRKSGVSTLKRYIENQKEHHNLGEILSEEEVR